MGEKIVVSLEKIIKTINPKSFEEIEFIVLECGNCGHKDILGKFVIIESYYSSWSYPSRSNVFNFKGIPYNKYFYCPKCKSSYVLCPKDDLVVRGI